MRLVTPHCDMMLLALLLAVWPPRPPQLPLESCHSVWASTSSSCQLQTAPGQSAKASAPHSFVAWPQAATCA
jgi:hypothetical protein